MRQTQTADGPRRTRRWAPLITLVLAAAALAPVSVAQAGEWAQRSCSFGTEYIAPEGWEGKENHGYDTMPNDNCERFSNGGGLLALATGFDGSEPFTGQTWLYKAPHDSTIAGGVLSVQLTARHGGALIAAPVKGNLIPLARCESPGCSSFDRDVPITAVGATELYETASCFPNGEGVCPAENFAPGEANGVFAAEANISSAQIILSTNATPTGSGLSGTLLNTTVAGKGTLSFTATDPGPGVYQARAKIDGKQVWAQTPNLNEGKCVSTGTTEGVRAFNYAQPCPAETAVHAEINTAGLTDGPHALAVEVEDAAGNTATVYSGTIAIDNHPPPPRGPANGTPASDQATLTVAWQSAKGKPSRSAHLASRYGLSHLVSGRLTTPAGAPIAGAAIEVTQTPAYLGASAAALASAHTGPDGTFTLTLPASLTSTTIVLSYRSHLGDTSPAATAALRLSMPARIHLKVTPRVTSVGRTIVLRGTLAGPIPRGGKLVVFEARAYGSRSWIEFHNETVTGRGRFSVRHRFALPGPARYQFRVVCEQEPAFAFQRGVSNVVLVRER